jgi:hypothetical protein
VSLPRLTDGEVLFTIAVRRKTVLYLVALLGAGASPGAIALSKSCNAEDRAAITQVATATTDVEADAAYVVWRNAHAETRADIAALVDRLNRTIAQVAIQEAALAGVLSKPDRARLRRSSRPVPPVPLRPKPPPPPTPAAAAAAVAAPAPT